MRKWKKSPPDTSISLIIFIPLTFQTNAGIARKKALLHFKNWTTLLPSFPLRFIHNLPFPNLNLPRAVHKINNTCIRVPFHRRFFFSTINNGWNSLANYAGVATAYKKIFIKQTPQATVYAFRIYTKILSSLGARFNYSLRAADIKVHWCY